MPLSIYKCSAGSGKTYTLVKEYVTILIENPWAFKNVLALTFTNKATQEMKERIITALAKLANRDFAVLESQLQAHFLQKGQTFDIQQQAKQALSNILHHYSEFTVTTIDSFFQGVLRSFAKELGHNIKYDIEMNSQLVLDNITNQLLKEVGKKHTKSISNWLLNFSYSLINEGKSWKIENAIKNLGNEIFKESYTAELIKGKNIEEIDDSEAQNFSFEKLYEIEKDLKKIKQDFENELNEIGKQGNEIMAKYGVGVSNFAHSNAGVANFFNNLQKNEFEIKTRVRDTAQAADETEIFEKWIGKTKLKSPKSLTVNVDDLKTAVNSGLHNLLLKATQIIDNESSKYFTALEVLKNFYTHAVLFYLKKQLINYRTDNSVLLISDISYFLLQVIANNESPFIYEKIGNTFKHILLDEFQDTSEFQWRNLMPLVKNALAETEQKALIVGDVKQSIYRWRGGKTELLLSEVDEQLHNFVTPHTHQVLEHNYRSAPEIIAFNNAFFESAAQYLHHFLSQTEKIPEQQAQLITQAYQDVAQKTQDNHRLQAQGQVHIAFLKKTNPEPTEEENDNENNDPITAADAEAYTLKTIKDLQNEEFTHKDITILVRNNFEGARIAEYLTQNQIKVISSEALLLKTSPKVQLLISALQFLALPSPITHTQLLSAYLKNNPTLTPENESYQPHEIFTDFKKVTKNETEQVSPQNYQDTVFAKIPSLQQFITNFDSLKQKPIYEILELLVHIFELDKTPDAYIQHFQDVVLQQTQKQCNTLFKFLEWWEQNQQKDATSLVVPKGENAVTIMTIHKAKGLEFTVVIVPFADWKLKPSAQNAAILWVKNTENEPFTTLGTIPVKDSATLEKTLFNNYYQHELVLNFLDNLNLLYVAFTRPTHRLYAFASKTNINNTSDKLSNIDKLIYQTLNDNTTLHPFLQTNGENEPVQAQFQFLHATPAQHVPVLHPKIQAQNLTQYFCEPYYNKIRIKDNSYSEEQEFGTQMHNLLKDIFSQKNEIENTLKNPQNIIKQAINKNELFTSYQENAKKTLQNLLQNPTFTTDILPKIKSHNWEKIAEETIIFSTNKKSGTTYGEVRPDYVLINHAEKELIIIDYKTGEKNEENNTQILNYEKVVRAMYKKYKVKTYLIYLNPQSVSIVIG